MSRPLRVLLVEDSEEDAFLMARALAGGGCEAEWERVASREGMEVALERGRWDVVLSDWALPGFGGREALEMLRARDSEVPFLLVSGQIGEEAAVEMMRAGAADYLSKDRLFRLAPVVAREVMEAERRREAREALARQGAELEIRMRHLDCLVGVSTALSSGGGTWSRILERVLALLREGLPCGDRMAVCLDLEGAPDCNCSREPGRLLATVDVPVEGARPGSLRFYDRKPSEPPEGWVAEACRRLLEAVAERLGETLRRRHAEQELGRREAYFRSIIEGGSDGVVLLDSQGTMLYASPQMERLLGYPPVELVGRNALDLVHPEDRGRIGEFLREGLESGRFLGGAEYRTLHRDGTTRWTEANGANLLQDPAVGGILVLSRDVTERRNLQEQVAQFQKMEAVGRLAGGIAHDFNNLLTVISGNASLLLEDLPGRDPRAAVASDILGAARRGTELTRQLLAFSRRQPVQPRVLELNSTVRGLEPLLRRVLGEDMILETRLDEDAGYLLGDPTQMEQVLLNLVINSREAMPGGGHLEVRTGREGSSVLLSVADDGPGMPPAVRDRAFEPFFTTKATGTGLGLSTVYGIVLQCGGRVELATAPGEGTRFDLWFPGVPGGVEGKALPSGKSAGGGTETLLVAEDDPSVRRLVGSVLERAGYRVLLASSGPEALALAEAWNAPVHLLITDRGMPGMTGDELARGLRAVHPGLPVVCISGHPREEGGGRMEDALFLPKPFTPEALLATARRALEARAVPGGGPAER